MMVDTGTAATGGMAAVRTVVAAGMAAEVAGTTAATRGPAAAGMEGMEGMEDMDIEAVDERLSALR